MEDCYKNAYIYVRSETSFFVQIYFRFSRTIQFLMAIFDFEIKQIVYVHITTYKILRTVDIFEKNFPITNCRSTSLETI